MATGRGDRCTAGREKERTRRIWLAKCACNTDRRAKTDADTAGNRAPHMVIVFFGRTCRSGREYRLFR